MYLRNSSRVTCPDPSLSTTSKMTRSFCTWRKRDCSIVRRARSSASTMPFSMVVTASKASCAVVRCCSLQPKACSSAGTQAGSVLSATLLLKDTAAGAALLWAALPRLAPPAVLSSTSGCSSFLIYLHRAMRHCATSLFRHHPDVMNIYVVVQHASMLVAVAHRCRRRMRCTLPTARDCTTQC